MNFLIIITCFGYQHKFGKITILLLCFSSVFSHASLLLQHVEIGLQPVAWTNQHVKVNLSLKLRKYFFLSV